MGLNFLNYERGGWEKELMYEVHSTRYPLPDKYWPAATVQ